LAYLTISSNFVQWFEHDGIQPFQLLNNLQPLNLKMHPYAIIDLGTNTFNLLVFEQRADGIRVLHSEEVPVFLGKDGIEKGMLADAAIQRGLAALQVLKERANEHGATSCKGFGTSALRNAKNAEALIVPAGDIGIHISVIPGEEEAELILAGVRQAVRFTGKPALVMDIGGGSIEFILATEKALMWKHSFELGVTRLRERIPISEPITVDQEARIAAHLDDRLEPLYAIIERHEPHVLIGSAGSFDTLAAIVSASRDQPLDPNALTRKMAADYADGADSRDQPFSPDVLTLPFSAMEFDAISDRLLRMDREERMCVPGLPEHRVDTLPYALIAIERVLTAGAIRDLAWSKYALKEGAAFRMMQTF